jgi:hypothetical protein
VSRRAAGRTQACGEREARAKLVRAKKFLENADLIGDEADPDFMSVAAATAVLAGIAASDAACCKALGRRSRSENHHDAENLIETITPGGEDAANALRRLLNLKDEAHYGFYPVGSQELKAAMRRAQKLIDFAEDVLRR